MQQRVKHVLRGESKKARERERGEKIDPSDKVPTTTRNDCSVYGQFMSVADMHA